MATPNVFPTSLSRINSIKCPKKTPNAVPIIEIINEKIAKRPIICSFLIPRADITPISLIISLMIWSKNIVKTVMVVPKTNIETAAPAVFIAELAESISDAERDSLNKYDSRILTFLDSKYSLTLLRVSL